MAINRFSWNLWKQHFPVFETAKAWYEAIPDLKVAIDWRSVNFRDPIKAKELTAKGYTPMAIRRWYAAGYTNLDHVYQWLMLGQSPQSVDAWTRAGIISVEGVKLWTLHGFEPKEVQQWLNRGLRSPDHVKLFRSAGVTPDLTQGLILALCKPEHFGPWIRLRTQGRHANHRLVNNWILSGVDVEVAAPWVSVGASHTHAELLRAQGVMPPLLKRLSSSDCEPLVELVKREKLVEVAVSTKLEQWADLKLTLEEMLPWAIARISAAEVVKWKSQAIFQLRALRLAKLGFTALDHEAHESVRSLTDAQIEAWEDAEISRGIAPAWVIAGVADVVVAKKWMETFGFSPEQAAAKYILFEGDLAKAKRHVNSERSAMRLAQTLRSEYTSPSQSVVAPKLPPAKPAMRTLPYVTEDWLEEIIARAKIVQPNLRKVPNWPAYVELPADGVSVELHNIGRIVKGIVMRDTHKLWCSFDPETFEIESECETSEARYVTGISLCWFIDCSIVIPRTSSSTSALFRSSRLTMEKGAERVRYVPTATFSERRREASFESTRFVVKHLVSGHKRTLKPGHFGSERARANAPRHIKMAANETYVESHFRGTEEDERNLRVRLSRYSALGDALSGLS